MKFLNSLQQALLDFASENSNARILGEDIAAPYCGAFKVTKLVAENRPEQVLNTPISEAGATGLGIGLAIRGCPTVIEIMFGDFLTHVVDQLINHAAKFKVVSGGKTRVPLIIRTPVGAGRGYGIVHSQSLEKMFLGISGLTVIAPSLYHDPGALLSAAAGSCSPVLFIEHKSLYGLELIAAAKCTDTDYPVVTTDNHQNRKNNDLYIIGYGGTSGIIKNTLATLAAEEIWAEAIIPALISDTSHCAKAIMERTQRHTEPIVIIDEATADFGWSSQLALSLVKLGYPASKIHILAREYDILPASNTLEQQLIITDEKAVDFCYNILGI